MINGIINIYKEAGYTSHDVVAKMRGILKQKKIGHTGTLDPDATGVLPVCIGSATKLCDMLTDKTKTYKTVLLLGKTTDSQDISGKIISENDVNCKKDQVIDAAMSFVGLYNQIPPMYSALKINGQKLVDLARRGIEVERQARPVNIISLIIEDISIPEITMTITCSKGTYIRTLCNDIGEKLGCGGCMKSLVRTRVSNFVLEDAITLSELEVIRDSDKLNDIIYPVDKIFEKLPALIATEAADRFLHNGNMIYRDVALEYKDKNIIQTEDCCKNSDRYRVYDSKGVFIGVFELRADGILHPEKVFLGGAI